MSASERLTGERNRPTTVERRDAAFKRLDDMVREQMSHGMATVEVDCMDLFRALATLDAYREMLGLDWGRS